MLLNVITVKNVSPLFFSNGFEFRNYVCKVSQNFTMLCLNYRGTVIITVKDFDHCCIIYDVSKSDTTHFLENSVF